MLAERRKKQKWSSNPCGHLWTQDDSRFGKRMLEKMGWNEGKGLGKQEQGINECVKLKVNGTGRGLGFEGNGSRTSSTFNDFDYDNILSGLCEKYKNEDMNFVSKPTTEIKQRHRYRKFVCAKDVRRYSKKDINAIFSFQGSVKKKVEHNTEDDKLEKVALTTNKELVASITSTDYFKSKLKENCK